MKTVWEYSQKTYINKINESVQYKKISLFYIYFVNYFQTDYKSFYVKKHVQNTKKTRYMINECVFKFKSMLFIHFNHSINSIDPDFISKVTRFGFHLSFVVGNNSSVDL